LSIVITPAQSSSQNGSTYSVPVHDYSFLCSGLFGVFLVCNIGYFTSFEFSYLTGLVYWYDYTNEKENKQEIQRSIAPFAELASSSHILPG